MSFMFFFKVFVNAEEKILKLKWVGHHEIPRFKVLVFNQLQKNK